MLCNEAYEFITDKVKTSSYNYLEIGVFEGENLAKIAEDNPTKMIFAIDPFIEDGYTQQHSLVEKDQRMSQTRDICYNRIKDCSNIYFFEMTSSEFLPRITPKMTQELDVGIVLIDGSHHYHDVIIDIDLALRLIGDRSGIIIFDDLHIPGVRDARNRFIEQHRARILDRKSLYDPLPNHVMAYFLR